MRVQSCSATETNGGSACHFAASAGHHDLLGLLISRGADFDARAPRQAPSGTSGRTPAMAAASAGHEDCLRVLAAAGADLPLLDERGRTACAIAELHGHLGCAAFLRAAIERESLDADLFQASPSSTPTRL